MLCITRSSVRMLFTTGSSAMPEKDKDWNFKTLFNYQGHEGLLLKNFTPPCLLAEGYACWHEGTLRLQESFAKPPSLDKHAIGSVSLLYLMSCHEITQNPLQ